MQEVPILFFARDFDFGRPETFAAVCGSGELPASMVRTFLLFLSFSTRFLCVNNRIYAA